MRVYSWLAPLAAAVGASFLPAPAYTPLFAIAYADRHWNWSTASGGPALVVHGNTRLMARRVPGAGWFQPAFQCAEYASRSLHAGGVPVPLPPASHREWPVMVNVDRLSYFLLTRGWAHVVPVQQVRPGDLVLFRYPHWGASASPNVWSHIALVVRGRLRLVDAHNAAHRHIPLFVLTRTAKQVEALAINPRPRVTSSPGPVPPGSEAAIAWRDVWTSRGIHLFWGQIFRVRASRSGKVWLNGVAGSLPTAATAEVPPSPMLRWNGHPVVVLGISPDRRTLISTSRSPIPSWTGRGHIAAISHEAHWWTPVTPEAVLITHAEPLEPVPVRTPIPKAFAPADSITVMDAVVRWHHKTWAQVEWQGAHQGLGYLPINDVRARPNPIVAISKTLTLKAANGGRITVHPPAALATQGCRYAYAGALIPSIPAQCLAARRPVD